MNAIDKFTDKFLDEPSLIEWLLGHNIEVSRFLESRFSERKDQVFNYLKFLRDDPLLGYLLTSDSMKTNTEKQEFFFDYCRDNHFVCSLVGKKGGGKSALMGTIAEELHRKTDLKIYWFEAPPDLPKYIIPVMNWDELDDNSIAFYDETAITYSSRKSMTKEGKDISDLLAVSRHHGMKVFFASQHFQRTEIAIYNLSDCFLIKPMQMTELGDISTARAKTFYKYITMMQPRTLAQTLFTTGDEWMLFETPLASFWTETISRSYAKMGMEQAIEYAARLAGKNMRPRVIMERLKARGISVTEGDLVDWMEDPEWSKEEFLKEENKLSEKSSKPKK